MNKENLLKMADFVEKIPQERFDLRYWRMEEEPTTNPECETVGCIIGHCTALDVPNILKQYITKDCDNKPTIAFYDWALAFTGVTQGEYDWCFSSYWQETDATVVGAAKRLRYLVHNGLPTNYLSQIHGHVPLIYNQITNAETTIS